MDEFSALKSTLEVASAKAGWATLAVTAGIVIELVTLFLFNKEMPSREKWTLAFATSIIAAGCGAEYWYGGTAANAAEQMQIIAQTQTAEANDHAGKALKEAAEIRVRAAKLEVEAAPRDINPPKTFIPAIAAIQRRRVVKVSSYASDAEGGRLAAEFLATLRNLKFVVQDDSLSHQALRPLAFGVQITGPDADLVSVLLTWINDSDLQRPSPQVSDNGVSVSIGYGQTIGLEPPSATIFVGSKPLPLRP